MRMSRAIWLCRILVTLVACGLAVDAIAASDNAAVASQLPDMGSPENAALSKADEFQVGRMIIREMRDQNLLLDDPEIADYVQTLGSRLGTQTNRDEQNYQYFVIKDPEINAFALYGGFICVHSGLIMLAEDESQLASVLAHETAHIRQRHLARAYQAESKMSLASTAALLAAVLIGALAGANGGAMEGMIAMSQGVALQQAMNFTRAEEAEADRVGIGLLANAGFRTSAMADFFETMARGEGISEASSLDMLRNHPVTRDRIAEARERAAQVEQQPVEESGLFPWMKERLRVVIAPPEIDATVYYSKLSEERPLNDPERYGQALAQLRQCLSVTFRIVQWPLLGQLTVIHGGIDLRRRNHHAQPFLHPREEAGLFHRLLLNLRRALTRLGNAIARHRMIAQHIEAAGFGDAFATGHGLKKIGHRRSAKAGIGQQTDPNPIGFGFLCPGKIH